MSAGVQRLSPAHERAALAFLDRAPYENVFLTWLIESDRSSATRSSLHVYVDGSGRVRGCAFFGRQVVVAGDDDAVDAFAETAPAFRFERMIVGPRAVVERYWARVRLWHPPARIVRSSQPLLALDRAGFPADSGEVIARKARADEWATVARYSADMIEHELEYDPRASAGDFGSNVRRMIALGLWWVGERNGEICFVCNTGPSSDRTLQLQGIWTPPEQRGKGLASQSLRSVCAQLPESIPTVSLYVNGFNAPALALYERVGFAQVGEFSTILF
ncbi:MAG: GNAT family N-acetyltransferase [Candidatus Eremiobacteraeota bacterium]|nr:GNAT family N-acetyltransferase [Candidatus Eremiobacteraeota bacterium]